MLKLHPNADDLTGRRFGRLVVAAFGGRTSNGRLLWTCKCDCGAVVTARANHLASGATRSCGCFLKEWCSSTKSTHGMGRSSEYRIWGLIKDRCFNDRGESYAYYGARGITMCERWRNDFSAFYADMGPRPSPKHQVDRIDNNGNYEPGNCRWAVGLVQANNKRNNVNVTAFGKTQTVAQWSRETGISDKVIYKRLVRGWSPERAVAEALHQ